MDIHNHWLRQEAESGRIQVEHTPSSDMVVDGLTKALQKGGWSHFLAQLGLVDVNT